MFTHLGMQLDILALLAVGGLLLPLCQNQNRRMAAAKPATTQDYLFKIARLTGASEYDIFRKSAEDWPVPASMVDKDFKDDLLNQATPYYVNAFVRQHKRHVDSLKLPPL